MSKTDTVVCPDLNTLDCVVDGSGFNRTSFEEAWVSFYSLNLSPSGEAGRTQWELSVRPEQLVGTNLSTYRATQDCQGQH